MPHAAPIARTYQQLLNLLSIALRRLSFAAMQELGSSQRTAPGRPFDAAKARTFAVLSLCLSRSTALSRYLATLPVTDEERAGRIMPRLEFVFRVFAEHKVDLATYNAWIDDDLAADFAADLRDDDGENDSFLEANMVGRRPMVLVAEMCRDFGIATHTLPAEWLQPISPELRLLCARAAAASICPKEAHRSLARSVRPKGGSQHYRH